MDGRRSGELITDKKAAAVKTRAVDINIKAKASTRGWYYGTRGTTRKFTTRAFGS